VFLDRAVDPNTGTLRVRAEFANPHHRLRPGLFGRLRTLLTTRTNAVLVPQRALQEIQGAFNVFKIDASNVARFALVKPGERIGPLWIIEDGLLAGDRIVVEGLLKVRDGSVVTTVQTNISDAPIQELRQLIPAEP
jgi:membrane fusion protein (multidrug efflux system)